MDKRESRPPEAALFWVIVVSVCTCACFSPHPTPRGITLSHPIPVPSDCTSLGQDILKGGTEYPGTGPLVSFVGIAGMSDADFAKRRQEYAACAKPILATLK